MNWKKFIHSDSAILNGKPVIKGTRISVEFILDLLAKGWNENQILENYPDLTSESINAVFAYLSETIHDESLYFQRIAA